MSAQMLTEEELYEARSLRYVEAARVVRLASGKFVIFSMTRGEVIGVAAEPEVNTQIGDAVVTAIARSASFWEEAQRAEAERALKREAKGPGVTVTLAKSSGDLGL